MRFWLIDDKMSYAQARTYIPEPHELVVSTIEDEDFLDRAEELWDLILIDEDLEVDPAAKLGIFDGSSLVGWLRAKARLSNRQLPPLAIFTSQPELFANEVPAVGPARPLNGSFVGQEAALAPVLDVEWLFQKADGEHLDTTTRKIIGLAAAYASAKDVFGANGASFPELLMYCRLPDNEPWKKAAIVSIERARPPISQGNPAATPFRGPTSVVRWMLHATLPFPGAFVSDRFAAIRLRITPRALSQVVSHGTTDWARSLASAIYDGPCEELFARRWWSAGVEDAALQLHAAVRSGKTLRDAAREYSGLPSISLLRERDPVVVVDSRLLEIDIVSADSAVQIRPPGWPPQSSEPWMRVEDVATLPWLRHMVDPVDQSLL